MGNNGSSLKRDRKTLKVYTSLTVFTEDEILRHYEDFRRIGEAKNLKECLYLKYGKIQNPEEVKTELSKVYRIPDETFIRNFYDSDSELSFSHNPFHRELLNIFKTDSISATNKGVSFDDYLDMMNALSSKASLENKTEWCFRLLRELDLSHNDENAISKLAVQEYIKRILPEPENQEVDEETGKSSIEDLIADITNKILDELGTTEATISKDKFAAVIGKAHDQFFDSFTLGR